MPKIIAGEKYGKLTILGSAGKDQQYRQKVSVHCYCGVNFVCDWWRVHTETTKSCGCLRLEKIVNPDRALVFVWHQYRKDAIRRNLEFPITVSEFHDFAQQNCHYCGVCPSKTTNLKSTIKQYTYNGIDRLDSKQGYILDNCVPCCTQCNLAKSDLSIQEFETWLSRLVSFRGKHE